MPQNKAGLAIRTAFYEYLLITIPVGLYIGLEAKHEHNWALLVHSPEWAVATIFLLFQGVYLYVRHMTGAGAKISPVSMGLLALVGLTLIAFTVINAYTSLDPVENTTGAIIFRLGLFITTSGGFIVMVAGANLYHLKKETPAHG